MKKLIFIFLILSPALCKAQKDSVRYEMYVRCCMGEVFPNEVELLYSVYRDTTYIGFTFGDHIIILPDTGCYCFQRKKDTLTRCFEHGGIYRDTFDFEDYMALTLIWDSDKRKYIDPKWRCRHYCIVDGYHKKTNKSGKIEWEGLFKSGVRIWYKSYDENGNLIYYSKRNFWGKEKVKLNRRLDFGIGKRKDEDVE